MLTAIYCIVSIWVFFKLMKVLVKATWGADEMRDRSHLLADSDRICTAGAYMDSIADTSYSRDHEHGNCSITALFE